MQRPRRAGVFWPVTIAMPLNLIMTKYQRFVAWRYLLERERELSSSVLGFIGFCLWLALGMGAACLWYPLVDPFLVPPPNAPLWLIPMIGLACALPVVALLMAAFSAIRGIDSRRQLLLALHGVFLALASFAVFEQSVGSGLSSLDTLVAITLFPLLAIGVPVQGSLLITRGQGKQASGLTAAVSILLHPLGVVSWFLMRLFSFRHRTNVLSFLIALQVAALEVVTIRLAYIGLRNRVWMQMFPEDGTLPLGTKVALVCVVVGVVGAVVYGLSLLKTKRRSLAADVALGALGFAGVVGIGMHFSAGITEVGANLEFLGGWSSYTPPMGMIMPALVAAAIAILAGVLLLARYAFTFFTTVSIGGVTIGTMALVIVLSVMSGFESDLREKILGFNAHIQVSRDDAIQFEGYREVQEILKNTKGVVGFTPFLTTEAYMSNHNNYGNVTLKGIDPDRVAGVTDIVLNLEKGDERGLEKIWPLDEDGAILGAPHEGEKGADFDLDEGPTDFSGGLDEIEEPADEAVDDFELGGPDDLSGGVEKLPEEGAVAVVDEDAGPMASGPIPHPEWDVDLRPDDYINPDIAVLDGVLVGRELVKTVNLYTGQEVRVISPLPDTSPDGLSIPRLKNFRVAGRFFSGMYEYDLKYVYCSLSALQDFLDLGDVVNGIEVRVKDPRNTAAIVKDLQQSLGEGYHVQDWKELNRALFSALKLEKIAMFFILVIIVLVASFSIVGNLIMVVIEKAKEIAILKTLGSSNGGVMKIFITQGFFIGLVGTSLGIALGLGACYLGMTFGVPLDPDVYYIDKLPIQVEGSSVLAVGCAGLAISVVATIYPAFIAARMRPVKGLRWD